MPLIYASMCECVHVWLHVCTCAWGRGIPAGTTDGAEGSVMATFSLGTAGPLLALPHLLFTTGQLQCHCWSLLPHAHRHTHTHARAHCQKQWTETAKVPNCNTNTKQCLIAWDRNKSVIRTLEYVSNWVQTSRESSFSSVKSRRERFGYIPDGWHYIISRFSIIHSQQMCKQAPVLRSPHYFFLPPSVWV